jgi:hypothetical protein
MLSLGTRSPSAFFFFFLNNSTRLSICRFQVMSPSFAALLAVASAVAIAIASASPLRVGSTCAIITGLLPELLIREGGHCTDNADLSANLTILSPDIPFFSQVNMFVNVQPCKASGPTIDISVQDTDLNVSYVYPQFDANANGSVTVPLNLSLSTPLGSLGLYATYNISGEAWANTTFALTVDLCFASPFKCASQMPDPYPKFQQTLLFGSYNIISHCLKNN